MTTARVTWETAFAPGFRGVAAVLVEGVPVLLTPSGVRPTTVAVTSGTVDPLFWPGTGALAVTRPDGGTLDITFDVLDADDRAHWDAVLAGLDASGIRYEIDHGLVRGLDYYTRTAFEVHDLSLASQSALGGGDPATSFVFEDSFSGLQAGLSGGFITIALATTNTREQLAPVGAHRIVKDLSEVDPQWLARGRLA